MILLQIDNIVSAVAGGSAFQALLDKMGDLEEQQTLLLNRVDELQSAKRGVSVTADDLRGLFAQFRMAVENGDVPELKRFVDAYVDRVMVHRDRVEVSSGCRRHMPTAATNRWRSTASQIAKCCQRTRASWPDYLPSNKKQGR